MMFKSLCFIILLIILNLQNTAAQRRVTILHTNDLHSSLLEDQSAETPDQTIGGFSRIATLIKNEKANNPNIVIALDAGDFLMGTFFQVLEAQSGFQLQLMGGMGYDAVALGNHEFDLGVNDLTEYARLAHEGGAPALLLSNLAVKNNNTDHQPFARLYADDIIKPYHIIEKDGIRIGVFSLLGREAFRLAPGAQIFELKSPVITAKRLVKKLRQEEQVDLVICLSHSGTFRDDQGRWENKGDILLANQVKGIDLIISGHTHTKLEEPLIINGTPIVQAEDKGQYVGKITLDPNDKDYIDYRLIPVTSEIACDNATQIQIDTQFEAVKRFIEKETKLDYDMTCFETQYLLKPDQEQPEKANLGAFIADAMRFYVNQYDSIGTNITFIAQGFIRRELQPGVQDLEGIFEVTSLGKGWDQVPGYPLSRIYFTAQELKRMLEFILIAAERNSSYHCFFSGITLVIDENAVFMQKIKEIYIADKNNHYQLVDLSKNNQQLYASTANAYIMEFFTYIRKMSYGLVNLSPKLANGEIINNIHSALIDIDPRTPGIQEAKVWKSVIEYGRSFADVNNNGIPDIPDIYNY